MHDLAWDWPAGSFMVPKNWFWCFCEGIFFLEAFSTAIYLWNDGLPWCDDAFFHHVQVLYLEWRYSHTYNIYIYIEICTVLCNEAYVMESRPSKTALTGTVPPGRWSIKTGILWETQETKPWKADNSKIKTSEYSNLGSWENLMLILLIGWNPAQVDRQFIAWNFRGYTLAQICQVVQDFFY